MAGKKKHCVICDRQFRRLFAESGEEFDKRQACTMKCNKALRAIWREKDPSVVIPPFATTNIITRHTGD